MESEENPKNYIALVTTQELEQLKGGDRKYITIKFQDGLVVRIANKDLIPEEGSY